MSGIESELAEIGRELQRKLWALVGTSMDALATELAGTCDCGRRRERRKGSVKLDVLGHGVDLPCTYFLLPPLQAGCQSRPPLARPRESEPPSGARHSQRSRSAWHGPSPFEACPGAGGPWRPGKGP